MRFVGGTVVGEHSLDGDAASVEPAHCTSQHADSGLGFLVIVDLGVGDSGVIVDDGVNEAGAGDLAAFTRGAPGGS